MISNFFVLSPRGDTIILKQYRSNIVSTISSNNNNSGSTTAAVSEVHERSHTEAFFRKIKFWDDYTMIGTTMNEPIVSTITEGNNNNSNSMADNHSLEKVSASYDMAHSGNPTMNGGIGSTTSTTGSIRTGDAPPVFMMPDGHTYFHIKRNGLIFGASTVRNVSANTVLEVRSFWFFCWGIYTIVFE
jgi:hypothetical protein